MSTNFSSPQEGCNTVWVHVPNGLPAGKHTEIRTPLRSEGAASVPSGKDSPPYA